MAASGTPSIVIPDLVHQPTVCLAAISSCLTPDDQATLMISCKAMQTFFVQAEADHKTKLNMPRLPKVQHQQLQQRNKSQATLFKNTLDIIPRTLINGNEDIFRANLIPINNRIAVMFTTNKEEETSQDGRDKFHCELTFVDCQTLTRIAVPEGIFDRLPRGLQLLNGRNLNSPYLIFGPQDIFDVDSGPPAEILPATIFLFDKAAFQANFYDQNTDAYVCNKPIKDVLFRIDLSSHAGLFHKTKRKSFIMHVSGTPDDLIICTRPGEVYRFIKGKCDAPQKLNLNEIIGDNINLPFITQVLSRDHSIYFVVKIASKENMDPLKSSVLEYDVITKTVQEIQSVPKSDLRIFVSKGGLYICTNDQLTYRSKGIHKSLTLTGLNFHPFSFRSTTSLFETNHGIVLLFDHDHQVPMKKFHPSEKTLYETTYFNGFLIWDPMTGKQRVEMWLRDFSNHIHVHPDMIFVNNEKGITIFHIPTNQWIKTDNRRINNLSQCVFMPGNTTEEMLTPLQFLGPKFLLNQLPGNGRHQFKMLTVPLSSLPTLLPPPAITQTQPQLSAPPIGPAGQVQPPLPIPQLPPQPIIVANNTNQAALPIIVNPPQNAAQRRSLCGRVCLLFSKLWARISQAIKKLKFC